MLFFSDHPKGVFYSLLGLRDGRTFSTHRGSVSVFIYQGKFNHNWHNLQMKQEVTKPVRSIKLHKMGILK